MKLFPAGFVVRFRAEPRPRARRPRWQGKTRRLVGRGGERGWVRCSVGPGCPQPGFVRSNRLCRSGPVPGCLRGCRCGRGVASAIKSIGWLLLRARPVEAARGLAGEYALHALAGSARPAAGVWAAWYVHWSLSLVFPAGLLVFLVLLFPTGRPLAPRWWVVGWLALGLTALELLLIWIAPGTISLGRGLPSVPNPTGISKLTAMSGASNGLWALGLLPLLLAVASLFARYRRSAGEERLQLKWLAYARPRPWPWCSAGPGGSLRQPGTAGLRRGCGGRDRAGPPVGHRCGDLEVPAVCHRPHHQPVISYAIITAVIAGVFAGLVILATDVLPSRHQWQ